MRYAIIVDPDDCYDTFHHQLISILNKTWENKNFFKFFIYHSEDHLMPKINLICEIILDFNEMHIKNLVRDAYVIKDINKEEYFIISKSGLVFDDDRVKFFDLLFKG